jgi:UDP-glucuronate decarboxylase
MLENDGRVVSNFIVQALKGIPITIYGTGAQTRSFCYVDDMVTGLISLMHGSYIGPVNLGNPGEYTIKQLADNVQQLINPDNPVVYKEVPSDDPRRRKPDISKAIKYLDWQPKVELQDGLKRTIEDFRKRHEEGDF